MAVWESLLAFQKKTTSGHIKILSDNVLTVAYINHQGSPSSKPSHEGGSRPTFLGRNSSTLPFSHPHNGDGQRSGRFSKPQTAGHIFSAFTLRWGSPEVDLFTTENNKKGANYSSLNRKERSR